MEYAINIDESSNDECNSTQNHESDVEETPSLINSEAINDCTHILNVATDNTQNNVVADNVRSDLVNWAVTNNISHTALNSLLNILQSHECFSGLPCDRTLLHTARKCPLKIVYPGHYCHFGLKKNWKRL